MKMVPNLFSKFVRHLHLQVWLSCHLLLVSASCPKTIIEVKGDSTSMMIVPH
jgi:hypothetical protein